MVRLGRSAVQQAVENAKGPAQRVELAPTSVVPNGQWTMPVQIDPFTVSQDEKHDFIGGVWLTDIMNRAYGMRVSMMLGYRKEVRTFASSEGTFQSQTVFDTDGMLLVDSNNGAGPDRAFDFLTSAGAGWEYVLGAPYEERLDSIIEDNTRAQRSKPVEIGRYDVVLDARAMATMLDATLASATELDRAMGYLANDEGTSYLDDPLAMLGSYQAGSPLVNVTATRSMPGGVATVKWDEEGVAPVEQALVTKGILTDFQTTRESASWLAPYYQKVGRAVRSSGGASASEATLIPRARNANYVLAPDPAHDATFNDLVAQVKRGYAFKGTSARSDFQVLNGVLDNTEVHTGLVCEIVNGKLGQAVPGAQLAYRAPEFWKNVTALGGARSALDVGSRYLNVPENSRRQWNCMFSNGCTIRAVPALITQQAIADSNYRPRNS
jgi:TldD protein